MAPPEAAAGEDEAAAEAAGAATGAVELRSGDLVEVEGLKAAALNGLRGQLLKLNPESQRWDVKLPDGEVKAIRPANLAFRAVGRVDDDGTLTLVGMATDHKSVQAVIKRIEEQLGRTNEAVALVGAILLPTGGAKAQGEEARIWLKLAHQAEGKIRHSLEDLQNDLEALDSIDASALSEGDAGELKMARKDLIRFVQVMQERLEGALARLSPVLRRLVMEAPAETAKRKHGWSADEEKPLHEKYREAFEKGAGASQAGETQDGEKPLLTSITVKYQGRGEKPPPSDNLYVKGLPGWISEDDVQAIFGEAGEVKSLKLQVADWGAIAFVRLGSRKEAAIAIQKYNCTVPKRLQERAAEEEGKKLQLLVTKQAVKAVVDQLARGVMIVLDLMRPLGIRFDDNLAALGVQEGSQSYEAGIAKGWRARSIGGVELATTKELVKNIGRIKKKGMKRAAIAFAPPPRVVSFTKRPLGLL